VIATRGAVVREAHAPLVLEELRLPEPGPDEVLIRVAAVGLCQSDLHFMHGHSGKDFPYLTGHEVSGWVEAVGSAVREPAVGDLVVIAPMVPCGACKQCAAGRPDGCLDRQRFNPKVRLADGAEAARILGVGGLAESLVIAARQAIRIDPSVPVEVAALLGCGVPSGYGAAVNAADVTEQDDVLVIGCGGVGLAAIAGAASRGAASITAVDTNPARLENARRFGATTTVDASVDSVEDALRAVAPAGADVVIDAVGTPGTFEQGFHLRARRGRLILVGAPKPTDVAQIPMRELFLTGGRLEVSMWGNCIAGRDLPAIVDLYLSGGLPLEENLEDPYAFEAAQAAYDALEAGAGRRQVVRLPS
jgi:S-(hydroxymethyl)mycothiol dehydrogenase